MVLVDLYNLFLTIRLHRARPESRATEVVDNHSRIKTQRRAWSFRAAALPVSLASSEAAALRIDMASG